MPASFCAKADRPKDATVLRRKVPIEAAVIPAKKVLIDAAIAEKNGIYSTFEYVISAGLNPARAYSFSGDFPGSADMDAWQHPISRAQSV
ncbi:MAG: hypothetical protein L0H65_07665 [Pseudorhodobacter sp.]|nr:hypothetical protein [Pseudorhodobacter sp.]